MITRSLMTSPHRRQRQNTESTTRRLSTTPGSEDGHKETPKNQKTAKHSTQPQRFKSVTLKTTIDSKQSKKDLKRPQSLKITTKQELRGSR